MDRFQSIVRANTNSRVKAVVKVEVRIENGKPVKVMTIEEIQEIIGIEVEEVVDTYYDI